jgi:hypothetical protein
MKHIVFLKAAGPARVLRDSLLTRFASGPPPGCIASTVNLVSSGDPAPPWDAVVELWTRPASIGAPALAALPDAPGCRVAAYLVTEMIEKNAGPPKGWPTSGVKMIVPWIGRADVPPAEQRRHWDEHVPLANRVHIGVSRYVRNWVDSAVSIDAPRYQGIATQHFPTEADLHDRLFDSPASVQLIVDDVTDFIAEHVALRVLEYSSPAPAGSRL